MSGVLWCAGGAVVGQAGAVSRRPPPFPATLAPRNGPPAPGGETRPEESR